nr:hypothetical protein [Nonomuraea typhae]
MVISLKLAGVGVGQDAVDAGHGGVAAFVLAGGDDELGRDAGHRHAAGAQVAGVGDHVVVENLGAAAVAATLACRGLAFQGFLPHVLPFGFGHAGEEGEQGGAVPGGVVEALQWAGEQFELDVGVAQVFGYGQQVGGAAAPAGKASRGGPGSQTRPGPRSAGVRTSGSARSWGARVKRGVWYFGATLPPRVRQALPAGAAHMGQPKASTAAGLARSLMSQTYREPCSARRVL